MLSKNELREVVRDLIAAGGNDLSDALSDLTGAEWRAVVDAAAMHRCVGCGEHDHCVCPKDEEP